MIINNQSTTIYSLNDNQYKTRSNIKQITMINPLNITILLTNENNNLIFKNSSGKNIYNFILLDDDNEIYTKSVIYNNQIITIKLNNISENNLTIKYSFYKNYQINTLYIFNIYYNPIIK